MDLKEATLIIILVCISQSGFCSFPPGDLANIKESLRISVENATWEHLTYRLERQLHKLWNKESSHEDVIPEIHYHRLRNTAGVFPESIAHKIRRRGIVIIRELLDKSEIKREQSHLVEYIYANKAFEDDNFEKCDGIYWSKAQTRLRQNEDLVKVQRSLLGLFHVRNTSSGDLREPKTLVSGLRIRVPKKNSSPRESSVSKGRLNSSGGDCLERWVNPAYQHVYRHILHDKFEDYDPFEMDERLKLRSRSLHGRPKFLSLFQGWLALSSVGAGSLSVLPLLREATAYVMLRAFLKDVPSEIFPGCKPGEPFFELSPFYHRLLHFNMIPLPSLSPGDAVWWHDDLIHSETKDVKETESIMRLLTGPDYELNKKYSRHLRHNFILKQTLFDNKKHIDERNFKGSSGFEDLNALGKTLMGWSVNPGLEDPSLKKCSCTP